MIFLDSERQGLIKSLHTFQERLFNRNILLKALPSKMRLDIVDLFKNLSQSNIVVADNSKKENIWYDQLQLIEFLLDPETTKFTILRPPWSARKPDSIIATIRKIQIAWEDYMQETGYNNIHIWYPFLFIPKDDVKEDSYLFAPLFLFDIKISIERDKIHIMKTEWGEITWNPILLEWLHFEKRISIDENNIFEGSSLNEFSIYLKNVFLNIRWFSIKAMDGKLLTIPEKETLKSEAIAEWDPQIFNCGLIGEFKFGYKPILADLKALTQIQ